MTPLRLDIKRIHWQDTIAMRNKVLWPNKSPEFCRVEGDEDAWHFGAYIDNTLVCVASVFRNKNIARLRKFATATEYQGVGIGTQMLEHILMQLANSDDELFWCDAREAAIDFYRRFNMAPEGERFYKSDVPYIRMSLSLKDSG